LIPLRRRRMTARADRPGGPTLRRESARARRGPSTTSDVGRRDPSAGIVVAQRNRSPNVVNPPPSTRWRCCSRRSPPGQTSPQAHQYNRLHEGKNGGPLENTSGVELYEKNARESSASGASASSSPQARARRPPLSTIAPLPRLRPRSSSAERYNREPSAWEEGPPNSDGEVYAQGRTSSTVAPCQKNARHKPKGPG